MFDHGAPARVGRLRGYGNAINAEAATAFVESYLEAEAEADRRGFRLTETSVLPIDNIGVFA